MQNDEIHVSSENHLVPAASLAVPTVLAPVTEKERIAVLDVIRGFALIGIFLMNIEFFNRAVGELGEGMPAGLTGLNWLASYVIAYFVAGKFWTIFSLLFGMGFALMLTRTETKGQNFLQPYLRRLFALAIFGLLHHILIWPGDILFSYAIAAAGLLLILFGKLRWIFLAALLLVLCAMIPLLNQVGAIAMALTLLAGIAFLLRTETTVKFFGKNLPITAVVLCIMGGITLLLSLGGFLIPTMKILRGAIFSAGFFFLLAFILARSFQPKEDRPWKIGSLLYCTLFISMIIGGAFEYWGGKEISTAVNKAKPKSEHVVAASATSATGDSSQAASASIPLASSETAKRKAETAEQKKKELEREKKKEADNKLEVEILTKGTYLQAMQFRAKEFAENWANVTIFSVLINCMFLIGFWFVRSGIMDNTQAHLPLFRKLALFGLPVGISLGIAGSLITTAPVKGLENDPFTLATGLLYLGNLPACLGYVSVLVLMFNSAGVLAKVKVLAPYGRMALTNYLSQSIICSAVFYSYGLGYYGMQRAHQVVFVLIVVILQLMFSHWWLSKFRYGPMEWLWRAVTYWKLPAFKV
ncbi:DUF418 domain-containing protein [Undibacterium danionis]|uniref:DUF418 domain-containing protein n=1 Tax=Undibacterium danionis TaxID=1812100 RepID=A0ABV6IGQ3_9BURK